MAKNMVFLVHKTNSSVIYTNSKSDLATILGVSLRTIIRNYSNVGKYESIHYIIYVGAEKYDNGKEYNYNHIVEPPAVKTYSSIKSPKITNNVDIVSHSNRVIEQVIENEPIETDWRIIEKNLSIGEYNEYYSTRTLEQLTESGKYFMNTPIRMKYINKYGALKQLE